MTLEIILFINRSLMFPNCSILLGTNIQVDDNFRKYFWPKEASTPDFYKSAMRHFRNWIHLDEIRHPNHAGQLQPPHRKLLHVGFCSLPAAQEVQGGTTGSGLVSQRRPRISMGFPRLRINCNYSNLHSSVSSIILHPFKIYIFFLYFQIINWGRVYYTPAIIFW